MRAAGTRRCRSPRPKEGPAPRLRLRPAPDSAPRRPHGPGRGTETTVHRPAQRFLLGPLKARGQKGKTLCQRGDGLLKFRVGQELSGGRVVQHPGGEGHRVVGPEKETESGRHACLFHVHHLTIGYTPAAPTGQDLKFSRFCGNIRDEKSQKIPRRAWFA